MYWSKLPQAPSIDLSRALFKTLRDDIKICDTDLRPCQEIRYVKDIYRGMYDKPIHGGSYIFSYTMDKQLYNYIIPP